MKVTAQLNYLRMSPRRVNMMARLIRGEKVEKALHILRLHSRVAAKPLKKLVESAVANAENKGNIDVDTLYIKEIQIGGGPTLKRWLPRAQGRATPIRKRTTHISLVLEES